MKKIFTLATTFLFICCLTVSGLTLADDAAKGFTDHDPDLVALDEALAEFQKAAEIDSSSFIARQEIRETQKMIEQAK